MALPLLFERLLLQHHVNVEILVAPAFELKAFETLMKVNLVTFLILTVVIIHDLFINSNKTAYCIKFICINRIEYDLPSKCSIFYNMLPKNILLQAPN